MMEHNPTYQKFRDHKWDVFTLREVYDDGASWCWMGRVGGDSYWVGNITDMSAPAWWYPKAFFFHEDNVRGVRVGWLYWSTSIMVGKSDG